ncbi:MAG: hypothetical protein ACI87J_002598 [Colwellia sp.]|jgi:hypothetical protein
MIANDQVDLDELIRTCDCLMEYFVKTGVTERRPIEIFRALVEKSVLFIKDEALAEQLIFDANEICEQARYPKDDYSDAKEFVVRNRKAFDKLIEENVKEITHFCSLNDVKYLPTIKNTDSKGGHKIYFYIGLVPISDTIKHELKLSTEVKQGDVSIEYTVPQLPQAPTWAKFLLNFKVQGWKFYSYVSLPMIAVVIIYLSFLLNLFSLSTTNIAIFIAIIFSVLCSFLILKPFYSAMKNRISIAPNWLLKLNVTSAQIRAVKTKHKRENGKYIRALQFVVYKADCPICGSEVIIEKGKYAHKGRLVGVCDESPREHVFSFDHVTKKGKLII